MQHVGCVLSPILRDGETGKFPCPCGWPAHSRYSSARIHNLCRYPPHPVDPDAFPDSEDECLSTAMGKRHAHDLSIGPNDDPATFLDHHDVDSMVDDDIEPGSQFPPDPIEPGSQFPPDPIEPGSQFLPDPIDVQDGGADMITNPTLNHPIELPDMIVNDDHEVLANSPPLDRLWDADDPCPDDFMDGHSSPAWSEPDEQVQDVFEFPLIEVDEFEATSARQYLRDRGIDVDLDYNRTLCIDCGVGLPPQQIHGHRSRRHCRTRAHHKILGTKDEILERLQLLNAFHPLPFPSTPIRAIDGLTIVNGYRCTVPACTSLKVFSSKRLVRRHCLSDHPEIPPRMECFNVVSAHQIGQFCGIREYVEVLPTHAPAPGDPLEEIFAHYQDLGVGAKSTTYKPAKNTRAKTPFVAKTKWDLPLQDVNLALVRAAASPPNETTEADLYRLRTLVKQYYHNIASHLDSGLSTLVLRYIHSADPEYVLSFHNNIHLLPCCRKNLKKIPYHKPQLSETIDKDADCVTTFTSFLIRTHQTPIDNFGLVLHPTTTEALRRLVGSLDDKAEDRCVISLFHEFFMSLISNPSPEFLADEWQDPLLRFLIVFHLQDDYGSFARAPIIPPNISKLQWAIRATCAFEIQCRKEEFNNDCFQTYERYVRPFLTEKHPTMFNTLRQQMAMTSSLSYAHTFLPLFAWDPARKNLSIDGKVLPMSHFKRAIHSTLQDLPSMIDPIFGDCPYKDILDYIDSRLDPSSPIQWFRDRPQEFAIGTSVFSNTDNELGRYRHHLLDAMSKDQRYFTYLQGKLHPKAGKSQTIDFMALSLNPFFLS
jgi:hypothetical protein